MTYLLTDLITDKVIHRGVPLLKPSKLVENAPLKRIKDLASHNTPFKQDIYFFLLKQQNTLFCY